MQVGSIMSTLGLNVSPFAAGMLQATSIASIFPSTVTSFMANPLLGFIDITKQAANAIRSMVTSAASDVDDLGKRARNLNMDIGELSTLQRIGAMEGVSDMGDGLRYLARNAGEAKQGTPAIIDAFNTLGVAATNADGTVRPLGELLLDVADGFKNITDENERANIAMTLLGRSGTEMVGMLSLGSAAIRGMINDVNPLGKVVSDAAYESSARFNDLKEMIGFAWSDIKLMLAEEMTVSLGDSLEAVLADIRSSGPEIRGIIQDIARVALQGLELGTAGVALLIRSSQELLTVWLAIKGAMAGASIGSMFGPIGTIVGGVAGGAAGLAGGAYAGGQIETNMAPIERAMERFSEAVGGSLQRTGEKLAESSQVAMMRGFEQQQRRAAAASEAGRLEGRL